MCLLKNNVYILNNYKKLNKTSILLKKLNEFSTSTKKIDKSFNDSKIINDGQELKNEKDSDLPKKNVYVKKKPKKKFKKAITLATITYQDVYPDGHPDHDQDPCHDSGIEKIRCRRDKRRDPVVKAPEMDVFSSYSNISDKRLSEIDNFPTNKKVNSYLSLTFCEFVFLTQEINPEFVEYLNLTTLGEEHKKCNHFLEVLEINSLTKI
jgi:hypothetical protein